jgi:serine/threonine-protein kinase Chk2
MPGGALENYSDISVRKGTRILQQCLSALIYLHGREPPIVHRDIKPANIFVSYRFEGFIHMKFGDFGLSRAIPDPTTICGTPIYLAPEIWTESNTHDTARGSYTPAVDIWSLGVTVCECVYGLPNSRAIGVGWCEEVVERLARDYHYADQLQQFLCDNNFKAERKEADPIHPTLEFCWLLADSSR